MRQPLSFQFWKCAIVLLFLLIFEQATNAEVNQTNSFTPAFSQPSILTNSKIEFSLTLAPDTAASIEGATNLTNWVTFQDFTNSSASNSFIATTSVDPTNRVSLFRAATIPRVAPVSLDGLRLQFTNNAPFGTIYFTDDGVFSGYYAGDSGSQFISYGRERSFNSWRLFIGYPGDQPPTLLTLNFIASDRGIFSYSYSINSPPVESQFMVVPPPQPPPPPPPPSGTAPPFLTSIAINAESGSVSGVADYTLEMAGGTTGTFHSGPDLFGEYQYQPDGKKAHLRIDYQGQFVGDYDDVTLDFSTRQFSGVQVYNGVFGPLVGSFIVP